MPTRKFEEDKRPFCVCGALATRKINGISFCNKHSKSKVVVNKIGRYSGKSKSENAFGFY